MSSSKLLQTESASDSKTAVTISPDKLRENTDQHCYKKSRTYSSDSYHSDSTNSNATDDSYENGTEYGRIGDDKDPFGVKEYYKNAILFENIIWCDYVGDTAAPKFEIEALYFNEVDEYMPLLYETVREYCYKLVNITVIGGVANVSWNEEERISFKTIHRFVAFQNKKTKEVTQLKQNWEFNKISAGGVSQMVKMIGKSYNIIIYKYGNNITNADLFQKIKDVLLDDNHLNMLDGTGKYSVRTLQNLIYNFKRDFDNLHQKMEEMMNYVEEMEK
ncbi:MAG TPA: hypothetical protein VIQ31_12405 [Phormidium sp.]